MDWIPSCMLIKKVSIKILEIMINVQPGLLSEEHEECKCIMGL